MKIDRQNIIFQKNLDGEPIQVNADNSGDVIGTIAGDISKELYSRIQLSNQEVLDNYPGVHWWAKDLEMYIPYVNGRVGSKATDGGVKMFFIDTNTTVGKKVYNAFKGGGDFETPGDIRGDGADIKKYFGSDRAWLPQLDEDGSNLTNVDGKDYMIYSGQLADEIGADVDNTDFSLLPCSPLTPLVYEHTINGSSGMLRTEAGYSNTVSNARAHNYGPCQYKHDETTPEIHGAFKKLYNPEIQNTFKNFVDDEASLGYRVDDFFPNPFGGNTNTRQTSRRYRNSVVPYVRDFIVQSDTHVCGGYFHTGTVNSYQDESDNEDIEDAGAFGRKIQNHPFDANNMDTVFEKGAVEFSESAQDPQSFYGIVITTAHLHNEVVGDDQTDATWYLALVKKSTVASFLENQEAQCLVISAGSSGIKNNKTGLYDSKKNRMPVSNLTQFRIAEWIAKRDNYGKGDESKTWYGGDDKRSPRASVNGIVISFRKPNPTTTQDEAELRGNVEQLNYKGCYTIGPGSVQQTVFNLESISDNYRFVSNSYNQLSRIHHRAEVDFGLFNSPGLDKNFIDADYTPVPYTYSINNNEATINQVYYDTKSSLASKVGVPAVVGLSYDMSLDGIRFEKSSFENIEGSGDFVNENNIGFKFAILDEGNGDEEFTFEQATNRLDGLSNVSSVTFLRKSNLYNFTDIFADGDEGIEYGTRTVSYTEPGLKELTGVIFMYHKRPGDTIQPVKWWITKSRLYLNYSSYFIEDFSEIGGPGFTLIPYPVTTPIISGISKKSKYFRSLDNIVDADQFSLFEVTDKSRCNAAIQNNELGNYIGDSDIGQTRIFTKPLRLWEQLGVAYELDVEGTSFYYDDLDFYDGGGPDFRNPDRKYPQESIATEVFISNSEYKDDCIVEMNPGIQTFNMLRDSSGNENKGILLGDYSLSKEDFETSLAKEGTMKVPKVSNQDRAY